MIGAWKVVSSNETLKGIKCMRSRAAVSPCERFLFCGEYDNPESQQRNAVITVINGETGTVVGNLILYFICVMLWCLISLCRQSAVQVIEEDSV